MVEFIGSTTHGEDGFDFEMNGFCVVGRFELNKGFAIN